MVGFVNQHDHHLNGGLIEKMFLPKKNNINPHKNWSIIALFIYIF